MHQRYEQLVATAIERHQYMTEACAWLAFEGRTFTQDELRILFRAFLTEWSRRRVMERTI